MASRDEPDASVPHTILSTGAGQPSVSVAGRSETLLAYIRRMSGRQQILICSLAVVIAALEAVPLELQRRIVNDAIGKSNIYLLGMLGMAFLGTVLVQGALKYGLKVYAGAVAEDVTRNSRRSLFAVATDDEHARPDGSAAGRSVSIVGSEIDKVGSFVGESLSEPLVQVGMLLSLIGYMLFVEPILAFASLAFFAPQVVLLPLVQRTVNRLTELQIGLSRDLGDAVAEATKHPSSSSDGTTPNGNRMDERLDKIRNNRVWINIYKYLNKAVVNLFGRLGPLCVLMVGGWLVIAEQTTLGVVIAFASGFDRIANSTQALATYYHIAANASVEFHMIADWVEGSKPKVSTPPTSTTRERD